MKITNLHTETLEFMTGVRDGKIVMEAIPAGETKNLSVKPDDITLRARLHAGLVSTDDASAKKAAAAATTES